MKRVCRFCGKKIDRPRSSYCNSNCNNKWLYHNDETIRTRIRKDSKLWHEANPEKAKVSSKKSMEKFRKNKPERFNALIMKSYWKNKAKWNSRSAVRQLLVGYGARKQYNPLVKKCKCGSVLNLEVHIEGCPTLTKDIKKDIDEGRIYYICRKCNRAKLSKSRKNKGGDNA